jgi:hypothetical protein
MAPKVVIVGKVIRIPDKYNVIIDVGKKQGVHVGMRFAIYEEGEPILTPDGKDLGKIEHVKALVSIKHVQENFSLAETIESEEPSTVSGSIVTSLRWKRNLPVTDGRIQPFKPYDKSVKVGDLAKQTSEGNGD